MIPEIYLTFLLSMLFIAYSSFAYLYARYSPWNSTWQGITLEAQKVTLALLVVFFVADTLIDGPWAGRFTILGSLVTLLAAEAWATLAGLIHVQRKNRAEEADTQERPGEVAPAQVEATTDIQVVDLSQKEGNDND